MPLNPTEPTALPDWPVLRTPADRQIARLLAEGMENKGIAVAVDRSAATVKHYVGSILAKSSCRSRARFISYVHRTLPPEARAFLVPPGPRPFSAAGSPDRRDGFAIARDAGRPPAAVLCR